MSDAKKSFLRRHLTPIVLVALLAVVSVITFIDRGSLTTSEAEARKSNLLPAWRGDDVTRVEVVTGGDGYLLTRPPKGTEKRPWDLTIGGETFPAEEQTVDKLLSTLDYAKFAREVPSSSVNRDELGLTSPSTVLKVTMGELVFSIALGGEVPTGEGVYAEVSGRGVYVISKGLAAGLVIPSSQLREGRLVPYGSMELSAVWLEGEGGTRKFAREDDAAIRARGFRFAEGSEGTVGERVDARELDRVFVTFEKLRSGSFLDDAVAAGASKPRVTLTQVPKEGQPAVLVIGGDCPEREGFTIVRRTAPTKLAACVATAVIEPLLKPASEFIDDSIVGATIDEITELSITQGDKVLDIARYGPGFKVRKPEERLIDADTGNALLSDIVESRGERAPAGSAAPTGDVIKVRIKSQGGVVKGGGVHERTEELEIGPAVSGKHIVLRKEDNTLLVIGDSAASALKPSDLLLRDVSLVDVRAIDIEAVTVEHGANKQRFTRSEASFSLELPKGTGLRADDGMAGSAVTAIEQLTAKRWVAEQAEPSFGLATPRFTITASIAKSPQEPERPTSLTLLLGARSDDGIYASISTQKGVFLVDQRVEDVFDTSFIARDAFSIVTADAERIEIREGPKKATLVRDGRQLRLEGGNESRAADLEKALSQLLPVRALASGPPTPELGLGDPSLKIKVVRKKNKAADDGQPQTVSFAFGAGETFDGVGVRYARRDDVDATYLVPVAAVNRVTSMLDAK